MTQLLPLLEAEIPRIQSEVNDINGRISDLKRQADEQISSLEEQRDRLNARLRHIQALMMLEGRPAGEIRAIAETLTQGSRTLSANKKLADEVFDLLNDMGREVHYKEIVELLSKRGIQVPGRNPGSNLVAHIHNDVRFVRPARGVYALREWYPTLVTSVGTRDTKQKRRRLARARSKRS